MVRCWRCWPGAERLAGIDLSEAELALARRRPALAGAELRRGRAQELPFPDASCDAVVSHMAFMLMADVEQVVAEVARVLVPGGLLAVSWESNLSVFYDMVVLEQGQISLLGKAFMEEARGLVVGGRLASSMRINFATARLGFGS